MKKMILALCIISSMAHASDDELVTSLNEYSQAVEKTQQGLVNPSERKNMINSKEALEAAEKVNSVTGGDAIDQETIYKISAQVLGDIQGKDPSSLEKTLLQAQKDPEAFMKSLSPDVQKQIRDLAGKVEDRKKKKP